MDDYVCSGGVASARFRRRQAPPVISTTRSRSVEFSILAHATTIPQCLRSVNLSSTTRRLGTARACADLAVQSRGVWLAASSSSDAALYAPGLATTARARAKLGAGGDFTTAPRFPLFGARVARYRAEVLGALETGSIPNRRR